jgi:hypothetical protein
VLLKVGNFAAARKGSDLALVGAETGRGCPVSHQQQDRSRRPRPGAVSLLGVPMTICYLRAFVFDGRLRRP